MITRVSKELILGFSASGAWKWLLLFAAFFAPIKEEVYVVLALVLVDFVCGVWKSIRLKLPFSSKKMGNTISKLGMYVLVILCAFAFDKWILETSPWLSKAVVGFVAATEMVSIAENVDETTGLNLRDFLQNLLKRKQ